MMTGLRVMMVGKNKIDKVCVCLCVLFFLNIVDRANRLTNEKRCQPLAAKKSDLTLS